MPLGAPYLSEAALAGHAAGRTCGRGTRENFAEDDAGLPALAAPRLRARGAGQLKRGPVHAVGLRLEAGGVRGRERGAQRPRVGAAAVFQAALRRF